MKTTILVLLILISNLAYSQITYTVIKTGFLTQSNTWDVNGIPPNVSPSPNGYNIIVNSGYTLGINGIKTVTGEPVDMKITGELKFWGDNTLTLPAGSIITIFDAGSIVKPGNKKNAKIIIGTTLVYDNAILSGTGSDIINSGGTLPIELIRYKVSENTFLFTTASQENVERFVIELYDENMNYIGELYEMPCNCLMIMEYIVPIENADVRYLRLVEYDYNGERVDFNFLHIQGKKEIDVYEENIFYTMDGKMLRSTYQELKPGVYIHNGKKVMKASSESY